MELLAALLLALAVFLGVRALTAPRVDHARARLDAIAADGAAAQVDEQGGVGGRVIRPMAQGLGGAVSALLPDHIGRWIEGEVTTAGLSVRPGVLVLLAFGLSLGMGILATVALADIGWIAPGLQGVLSVGAFALGAVAPVIWVQGRAARRQREIQRALPDTLDLIVVSVEAGLGFEAALARITEHQEGPLAAELRRVLQDVNLGISRREAMQAMAARARVAGVSSLVAAILQSERTGMGIGQVLRSQASHVRMLRRQHAEEAAMKAPLKMLFPLVFFIFPSLFVVILGPAIINLLQTLGGS